MQPRSELISRWTMADHRITRINATVEEEEEVADDREDDDDCDDAFRGFNGPYGPKV